MTEGRALITRLLAGEDLHGEIIQKIQGRDWRLAEEILDAIYDGQIPTWEALDQTCRSLLGSRNKYLVLSSLLILLRDDPTQGRLDTCQGLMQPRFRERNLGAKMLQHMRTMR